ncbi:MAG TPA: hypothetical protein DC049_05850 [Spirochaetia bacterium]|nr:hypothetical protein [Spirochaetia bacterium]
MYPRQIEHNSVISGGGIDTVQVSGKNTIIIFIPAVIQAQTDKTGWENDGLKGKVKVWGIATFENTAKFGKAKLELSGREIISYDPQGYRQEAVKPFADGLTNYSTSYKYYGWGCVAEEFSQGVMLQCMYKYDSQCLVQEKSEFAADRIITKKTIYFYGGWKNLVEIQEFSGQNILQYVYKFDLTGKIIKEIEFNANREIIKLLDRNYSDRYLFSFSCAKL